MLVTSVVIQLAQLKVPKHPIPACAWHGLCMACACTWSSGLANNWYGVVGVGGKPRVLHENSGSLVQQSYVAGLA